MGKSKTSQYSTSEVMKATGAGRNTLRLYEEMGLLVGMARTDSGYRKFDDQHLRDLNFIQDAKSAGFTLAEIKHLLDIFRSENQVTCGTVSNEVAGKLDEIDEQIKILESKKRFLLHSAV